MESGLKLVAIGGGTGLSTVLSGLKELVGDHGHGDLWLESLSAIVTVSDDGGSSGRLRDELRMLPPGDIRNCMVALSEDSTLLSRLFQYRFPGDGGLGGHSFGNLFLAALTEVTGDFVEAVRLSSEVLASKGRIYPATLNDVRLVAELEDGRVVRGETNITAAHSTIRRLSLEPEQCLPLPEALAAVRAADIITVGPGSLYTSILPNLLVARVAETIGAARAVKIFICNLMTQPGETDGYTARKHIEVVKEYAPEIEFDFVVVNDRRVNPVQAEAYAAEGARQIGLSDHLLEEEFGREARIVRADLLDEGKKVRHSPAKLARVLLACYEQACARSAVTAAL
ncbi:MAG: uridine diphosphate-N-acetylglucosamine-binding protein YvcK [Pyrinomonadaceae bacterium]